MKLILFIMLMAASQLSWSQDTLMCQKMGMFNVLITGANGYCLIETEFGDKKNIVYPYLNENQILKIHHIKIYNDTFFVLLYESYFGLIRYRLSKWTGEQWEIVFNENVALNMYRINHPARVKVLDYNKLKVSGYGDKLINLGRYEKSIQDSIKNRGEPVNEETIKKEKDSRAADWHRFRVELIEYDLTTKTEKRTEVKE